MSLRGSKAIAVASSRSPAPLGCTVVSSWPATTCAFVTTMPGAATQPEPADAQAAGVAEHAHDRAARGLDVGIARDRPRGGGDVAARPADARETDRSARAR